MSVCPAHCTRTYAHFASLSAMAASAYQGEDSPDEEGGIRSTHTAGASRKRRASDTAEQKEVRLTADRLSPQPKALAPQSQRD